WSFPTSVGTRSSTASPSTAGTGTPARSFGPIPWRGCTPRGRGFPPPGEGEGWLLEIRRGASPLPLLRRPLVLLELPPLGEHPGRPVEEPDRGLDLLVAPRDHPAPRLLTEGRVQGLGADLGQDEVLDALLGVGLVDLVDGGDLLLLHEAAELVEHPGGRS